MATPKRPGAAAEQHQRYRPSALSALVSVIALVTTLAVGIPAASVPAGAPDDPAAAEGAQWNLDLVSAPGAWPYGTGDGVTVAVVDSGVDVGHEDLRGAVVRSLDCVGAHQRAEDCVADPGTARRAGGGGHGTHVAGLIAARAGNGRGVAGVAPDAALQSVRVLSSGCGTPPCAPEGDVADVVAGVDWAIDHGAEVINLSLGTSGDRPELPIAGAISRAWAAGIIVVVAAGNEGRPVPTRDQPALVVTAVDRNRDQPAYARDVGAARWGLAAPGGRRGDTTESCRWSGEPRGLMSTTSAAGEEASTYGCRAGTSMAAAQVSGAAAVLRSAGYSPRETIDRLLAGAEDLGPPGPDPTFGAGLVDIERSVAAELAGVGPVRAEAQATEPVVPAPDPERLPWPLVAAAGGLVAFVATLMMGGVAHRIHTVRRR